MAKNNRAAPLQDTSVPSPEHAQQLYERSGGKLKTFGAFGEDPLKESPPLQDIRHQEFARQIPSFPNVFNAIVNNNPEPFKNSIRIFISITKRLAPSR